jgi:uncharacterized membrane protein YfcA
MIQFIYIHDKSLISVSIRYIITNVCSRITINIQVTHKGAAVNAQQIISDHLPLLMIAAVCVGLDKGGLKPLTIVAIYLLTTSIGARMTLAVVAPIMFAGEIFPAYYYRSFADTGLIKKIMPWILLGIFIGSCIGASIDEELFTLLIGIILLTMAFIILIRELHLLPMTSHAHPIFTAGLGVSAGFSTVIGNAAGGITSIYFLLNKSEKKTFVGSSALLYMIINAVKLMIYIFYWHIITSDTLILSLTLLPFIGAGIALATVIILKVPDRVYKGVILLSIIYSGGSLLIQHL